MQLSLFMTFKTSVVIEPVFGVRSDVTAGEQELDALQVTFCGRKVERSPPVEVAHVHVVAEEHVPKEFLRVS